MTKDKMSSVPLHLFPRFAFSPLVVCALEKLCDSSDAKCYLESVLERVLRIQTRPQCLCGLLARHGISNKMVDVWASNLKKVSRLMLHSMQALMFQKASRLEIQIISRLLHHFSYQSTSRKKNLALLQALTFVPVFFYFKRDCLLKSYSYWWESIQFWRFFGHISSLTVRMKSNG